MNGTDRLKPGKLVLNFGRVYVCKLEFGIAGTNPLGGTLSFESSVPNSYAITIDLNKDNIYGNGNDRTFLGRAKVGSNSVIWDGLDGNGNRVAAGNIPYNVKMNLYAGEAHFPMIDAEQNPNVTYTITATILKTASGTITNSATAARNVDITDLNEANNTDDASTVLSPKSPFADLLLVKRITAVNGQPTNPNGGTVLNQFIDDIASPSAANDNHPSWPANYLLGAFNAGITKPGDELEYTVYFLSSDNLAAGDVRVCDRIPTHTQFVSDTYNSLAPVNTGGGNRGILLNFNGQQFGLTNANDGDEIADTGGSDNGIGGYYFPLVSILVPLFLG